MMLDRDSRLETLLREARDRHLSRRDVLRFGAALGLSTSAIATALRGTALAQDATPNASGPIKVSILNKEMTRDEITAEIQKEGTVNVGNWTYTANDTLIAKFIESVKSDWGVDVKLNYEASQAPSTYLTSLYTSLQSNTPPSYDVMAIEENYWAEAKSQPKPVMDDYLPSGLVPNAGRVIDLFKHTPTAVGFQASATPGIVYNGA
ncbi:MAG TPA: hypothetical protein VFX03_06540, partial [Thermomicrobiales bacterium]|nr:hypothetical protein [Thermomicrobiales bacterium]